MKALSEAEAALADTLQQTISYHLPVLDITYARAFALELIECRNRPSMWTGTTTKVEISALEDVQRTLHRSERQLIGLPRDLRDSLEDREQ